MSKDDIRLLQDNPDEEDMEVVEVINKGDQEIPPPVPPHRTPVDRPKSAMSITDEHEQPPFRHVVICIALSKLVLKAVWPSQC